MLDWFKRKKNSEKNSFPLVDVHSHLLPGLDDGVQSLEEAEEIILRFKKLGYQKLITTPHVMSDFYRNTTEAILEKLQEVRQRLHQKNISIERCPVQEQHTTTTT